MPLSEEELRLLEQMEQALAQEDPKFVSTLRGSSLERVARMRTIVAGVVFVLGIGMLMGGTISAQIWLGVLGFVVMLASATIGIAAWRGRHVPQQQPQRSGEDQLFDFDDSSRPFDVIEGGRSGRSRRVRRPGGEAATPARQQAPQAGHLHAAHGAALGAPPQPGLLSPALSRRARTSDNGQIRPRQSRSRCTLPAIALRHDSTVSSVRERSSGSRVSTPASGPASPVAGRP